MYATPWHLPGAAGNGQLPGHLPLWRFERYYRLSADQLPAVLHQEALEPDTLRFARWQHAGTLTGARVWLFALPSGQVVAALSLEMRCALIEVIDLLEDCYFADVHAGETTITEHTRAIAAQHAWNVPPSRPPPSPVPPRQVRMSCAGATSSPEQDTPPQRVLRTTG